VTGLKSSNDYFDSASLVPRRIAGFTGQEISRCDGGKTTVATLFFGEFGFQLKTRRANASLYPKYLQSSSRGLLWSSHHTKEKTPHTSGKDWMAPTGVGSGVRLKLESFDWNLLC
jgi:hypothetical protein